MDNGKQIILILFSSPRIPRYLKIDNVLCHIVSDTSLLRCKIYVPLISTVCPSRSMPYLGIIDPFRAERKL